MRSRSDLIGGRPQRTSTVFRGEGVPNCRHEGGRGLRNADICISRKSFKGSQKSEKFDFSKCKNESVDHRFKSFAIN